MTATTVHIRQLTKPDQLFCQSMGEPEPRGCYVELDLAAAVLTADYEGVVGSGAPPDVAEGRVLRVGIPCLTADAANALLQELAPLAQRILDGASIEWDGRGYVGRLDADAKAALGELADRCSPADWQPSDKSLVHVWDAEYWYGVSETRGQVAARLGITAATSNERIAELAAAEAADATSVAEAGYVVLRGAEEYLRSVRDDLAGELDE